MVRAAVSFFQCLFILIGIQKEKLGNSHFFPYNNIAQVILLYIASPITALMATFAIPENLYFKLKMIKYRQLSSIKNSRYVVTFRILTAMIIVNIKFQFQNKNIVKTDLSKLVHKNLAKIQII